MDARGGGPGRLMPLRYSALVADAWARFRRDRDLLVRIAGPFLFLPALALELLVPPPPRRPAGSAEADALAWADALSTWAAAHGGWYLLAWVTQLLGTGAVLALYLHRPAPDVGGALSRAGRLLPRLVLAAALAAVPAGAGLLLWVLPGLYVLGRTMTAAPALVAEAPLGAAASLARAFRLSRGAGLPMTAAAATSLVGGYAASLPFATLVERAGGSPPILAVAALGSAAVAAAAGLANAMLAVSAYRMLAARQGT